VQDIFGGIASNNFISDGGSQTLYGGLAIFTEISAGGGQFVSAGGLASSTSIKADGSQTIFDHGIARDTVISGDGHQLVSSGGSATSTHIEEGGSQTIFSSGIASDTVVSSKGLQDVSSGGLAISTTVSSGGVQELHAGSASAADIKYGGSQVLYASASDFGAHLSGDQLISQGGVATSTHVEDGGSQTIFSGGSAIATEVSSGGMQIVSSAGTALSTRISSGGSQVVEASGVASNATIFAYGTQIISSAGSAVSTTVSSGGSQFVSDGAIVRDTVLKTGAYQEVEAVGSAYGTIIASGASQTVSGGLVSGTRLNGGSQTIFPDGSALRTIVEAGGLETIFGGSAIDTQIRAGGSQAVSGGVAIGTVVSSGGRQDVFQPGSALEVEVLSGGIQGLHGNTPDSGTEYRSGASQILYDGASSLDRAVSWVQIVSSGGAVSRGSLVFGGSQLVSSGGSATSVHISSGASQTIFEGGVASETRVSNGGWQIVSGGDAILTTVSSGGVQALYNATAEDADILRGGSQILFSGARDSATLLSGVQMIMSGGMATSTTVDSGGVQEVYSGGVASDTIVESRGTVNVFLGGSAMDVVQSSGGNVNIVAMGGTLGLATSVTGTNASGAALSLSRGVASGFIVYDEGYVSVAVGGSAIGTEVFSGGVIVASGGNIAGDTYIHASGNIVGDVVSMVGNDARLRMETELDENRETSASIAGTGAFHKLGAGTQTLTGNNTYDGPTIVSSGTLAGNIASGTDLTLLTAETVYDGRATSRTVGSLGGSGGVRNTSGFTVQSGGIFEGTIDRTNSGGVTMAGGSNMSLVLLGNNTYTGATSVASGGTILGNIASGTALHLGSNASYGGGSYEYDNDVVSLVGPANRVVGNLFGAQGARISDTSGLTVQGGGVFEGTIDDSNSGLTMAGGAGTSLVLMGENTYKGVTSVTRGGTILGNITSGTDLVLGSNASYGGGSYNSAGGLLSAASRVIGNLSGAKGARISDTDGLTVSGGGIFEGTIDDTNSGGLTKMGAGVLTLTGTSNAYFGSTLVAEGTIKGNINEDQDLVVAGGAFYDGANSGRNLPGIFGDGVISNVGGSGLTVTSGTFGGQILKTAALSKVGDAGTLTLTGHDAFSGPVAVYGGTLVVAGSSATINPTSLTMWNGTTFDFHEASPYADKATPLSVGALTVNGLSEKPAPPTILGNLRVGGDSRDPHTITYNLPETVANSAVLLTVSGSVAVDGGTKIALNFNGHYSGDIKRLVLIDVADDTTEGMGVYGTNGDLGTLTLVDDVTGDIYMLKVENLNDLVAVLMNVNPKGATYQRMKAYAESRLALLALINQGGEYIAYRGMSEVLAATKGEGLRIGAFGGMDGGRSRYDTGSDIDLLGQNVLAGIGVGGDSPIGRLSIGAFLDMGTGTYKSRNDFTDAMSVDGKGNTSYWGGGLMVRLDNSYGLHFEGIGRYGRGRLHFETEDIEYRKMTASFDTEADYYGAIAGLGWSFAIPGTDGKAKMDLGAKALWTELKPDTTTVQGNQLHFDDARSFRIRIGGRVGYAFNSRVTGYAGAYVEREFEGDQRARINERYVATPSLRGDTGIGEIGVTVRPMEDDIPLFLDIGVQGFTGTRQGLAGNVQVRLEY
jgi:autotransporter passenger strand-loop-strand repeat protein/autotransporter-associated beta strand protein